MADRWLLPGWAGPSWTGGSSPGEQIHEEGLRIIACIIIISGQRVKKKDGVDDNISENYNVSLPEVAEMLAECCYRCLGLNIIIMT